MITSLVSLAAVLSLCAAPAHAQLALTVSGGATVPLGDFGKFHSTGWMGAVGLMKDVGSKGLGLGGHLHYGENSWSDFDAKTEFLGAVGTVRWRIGDAAKPNVFVVGNLGYMTQTSPSSLCTNPCPANETTSNGMAYGAGAGIELPRGRMKWYLLARYLGADIDDHPTALAPLTIGVSFPLRK